MKLFKRGFTGLELVVGIGLVAIVVFLVLAITDPFERLREERDRRLESDAVVILEALSDFYVGTGRYPWVLGEALSEGNSFALDWKSFKSTSIGICDDSSCSGKGALALAGRLNNNVVERVMNSDPVDTIYIGKGGGKQAQVYGCFLPLSKKSRLGTGVLYKLSIDKPLSGSGLDRCLPTVVWEEEDVCYVCVVR